MTGKSLSNDEIIRFFDKPYSNITAQSVSRAHKISEAVGRAVQEAEEEQSEEQYGQDETPPDNQCTRTAIVRHFELESRNIGCVKN
jgi:hypothetical protein